MLLYFTTGKDTKSLLPSLLVLYVCATEKLSNGSYTASGKCETYRELTPTDCSSLNPELFPGRTRVGDRADTA